MNAEQFVIGLDFGTDSVRAVLVNASNGANRASSVFYYPRWKEGKFCDAAVNQYRQHPDDHFEGIVSTIPEVLKKAEVAPDAVKSICVDTTGSSPIALDKKGIPLYFNKEFEDNPNAMVVLWKDHSAINEAEEINRIARSWGGQDFTKYVGGIYSSEWFWAKIMHIIRSDDGVRQSAFTWMEHCDFITYSLVGSPDLATFKRSRCAAGHKAMWHMSWGGLPDDHFLKLLDPSFPKLKKQLFTDTFTSNEVAGHLSREWSDKLGLGQETIITVGTFDAHAGAVGAEVKENTLVRVMGTSTCDIIVAPYHTIGEKTVRGICGQVDGSVLPGMIGLEAGQSAFGDVLAWFKDVISWPIDQYFSEHFNLTAEDISWVKNDMLDKLAAEAEKIPVSQSIPIALDWINGRRTPDANQSLKAAIVNLDLGTKAPEIFRALAESICFGSRMIVERFREEGIMINSVTGIGGVAKKSSFIMQMLSDVLKMPINVAQSDQAPALGAAMYAATAAGIYKNVEAAVKAMGNGFDTTYFPREEMSEIYDHHYESYRMIGKFVEENMDR